MPPKKEITEEPHLPKPRIMQTCPINFGECKKKEEIEKEFNPSQVFLDIPYSGYKKEYEKAIKKTIVSFGLIPVLAETKTVQEGLLCNVCKTIQKSGFAVADISEHNANVLYELGIIHSLGKKCCILCNSEIKIPIDLAGSIINNYGDEEDIKKNVSKWVRDNVGDIAIKIAKQKEIFDHIFYQLKRKEIDDIPDHIIEIKKIGDITPFENEYNRVIDTLIELLEDERYGVRWKTANVLGMIGDVRAVVPLIKVLRDGNLEVRLVAALSLGNIGDVRAIKPLTDLLQDDYVFDWYFELSMSDIAKQTIEKIKSAQKEKKRE